MSRNYITTAADGSATVRRKVPPLGLKPSVGMTGCGKRKVPPLGLKPSAGMTGCGKRKVPPLGLKPSVGMTGGILVAVCEPEANAGGGGEAAEQQASAFFRLANHSFVLANKAALGEDTSCPGGTIFDRELHHFGQVEWHTVGELRDLLAATEAIGNYDG